MTGLVIDPVLTPVELKSWGKLHFILLCIGMMQTNFYFSRLKSVILAAKIIDNPSLHLPAASSQIYKNKKLCHNQAKIWGY
jgi:hypothetical protein